MIFMPPENYNEEAILNLYCKIFGIDKKKIINPSYQSLLEKDDKSYYTKLHALESEINKALETGNKELFMKLSKEYKMLLD